jgi:hypothetical protein
MTSLVALCRLFVIFLGAAGFLFGQVFTGEFSFGGTLAGVGGVVAGALGSNSSRPVAKYTVIGACAIGLVGAGLHAYEYYSVPHVPGNYYAWFLTVPFAIALMVIAFQAARRGAYSPAADSGFRRGGA